MIDITNQFMVVLLYKAFSIIFPQIFHRFSLDFPGPGVNLNQQIHITGGPHTPIEQHRVTRTVASKVTALGCTVAPFIPSSTRKASLQRPGNVEKSIHGNWWLNWGKWWFNMVYMTINNGTQGFENQWIGCLGKILSGNHGFYHQIQGFPVPIFPSSNSMNQ